MPHFPSMFSECICVQDCTKKTIFGGISSRGLRNQNTSILSHSPAFWPPKWKWASMVVRTPRSMGLDLNEYLWRQQSVRLLIRGLDETAWRLLFRTSSMNRLKHLQKVLLWYETQFVIRSSAQQGHSLISAVIERSSKKFLMILHFFTLGGVQRNKQGT